MSDLLEQIHQDHANASKILDLIEKEVARTRAERMPSVVLLVDAMRYMTNYLDLVHHPKEDVIFQKLVEKEPDVAGEVEVLRAEHQTLARLGKAFLEIVKAAEFSEFVLRDEFIARGSEYVEMLRSHMDVEEVGLLKRARGSLSSADLEEVDAAFASSSDPLMKDTLTKEYTALYRSLFE